MKEIEENAMRFENKERFKSNTCQKFSAFDMLFLYKVDPIFTMCVQLWIASCMSSVSCSAYIHEMKKASVDEDTEECRY